jgi:hypothetical protein
LAALIEAACGAPEGRPPLTELLDAISDHHDPDGAALASALAGLCGDARRRDLNAWEELLLLQVNDVPILERGRPGRTPRPIRDILDAITEVTDHWT